MLNTSRSQRTNQSFGDRRTLENYRDLLLVLVQKEMQVRYKNKALGYLWSIASPLASAMVFFVVFKIMMRVRVEDYTLVLMTGLFPWQWFANCVNSAPRMFAGNASLIKKLRFPRNIIPLSAVINHLIHFLLTLPVIVLLMFYYGYTPSWSWLYGIPILCAIQLVMVYGLSLLIASLNLFLRDLERLVTIIMNFAFYLAPILYTEDLIPERYKHLVYLHPAAPLMIDWRNLFLHGTLNPMYVLASAGYAIVFFLIGYRVYKALSWRFGEVL